MTADDKLAAVLGAAALALLALVVGGVAWWWSTRPPEPTVREGRVAKRIYEPAHSETYFIPIPHTTTSCSGSPVRCSSSTFFTYLPAQRWVPDRWRLVIVGCPRLAKDAVKTYCVKPSNRTIRVAQLDYERARIGTEWTIDVR